MSSFMVDNRLPSLIIPYPQCEHCLTDVSIEDGYAFCETCRIYWGEISEDAEGEPDTDRFLTDVQCGSIVPHSRRETDYEHSGKRWQLGDPQPCILPEEHSGQHLCPHEVTVTPIQGGDAA